MLFFLFSRDFVLAISGLFLDLYVMRWNFFFQLVLLVESRKAVVVGKERLFDGVKKGIFFFW